MRHVRAIFISDLHLGASCARTDLLLSFLHEHTADTLYLVGDVFDEFREKHNRLEVYDIITNVLDRPRVIYTPGNHDAQMHSRLGVHRGVKVVPHAYHTTATGHRLLVIHGDCFDRVCCHAPWLARFGCWLDHLVRRATPRACTPLLVWANKHINHIAAPDIEKQVMLKLSKSFIDDDEICDGIICGHLHRPKLHDKWDIIYGNCGDFIDSCTAIIENEIGELELIQWS